MEGLTCQHVLRAFATELDEVFACFSWRQALGRDAFLRMADAFGISTYLGEATVEDIFNQILGAESDGAPSRFDGALDVHQFHESLCMCADAITEKQWKVRPPSASTGRHESPSGAPNPSPRARVSCSRA